MLNEEEALAGGILVSLETVGDLGKDDLFTCIQDNVGQFLCALKALTPEDQELLLSYYLLGKAQATLGKLSHTTQTVCSTDIRMAIKRLGAVISGEIDTLLPEVLKKAKLEDSLKGVKLSVAVKLYSRTRSFKYVADTYNLHRPDLRRAMRKAATTLLESKGEEEQMVGAYVYGLLNKASASGQGRSKRQLAKQANFYIRDPACLGEFRIPINASSIDALFASRALR